MLTDVRQTGGYQVARDYRRDQLAISGGHLREVYQCDFDVAGTYNPIIGDVKMLREAGEPCVQTSANWE